MELGEPKTFKRLSIVPIVSTRPSQHQYLTLPEIPLEEDVTITESNNHGVVGELSLVNHTAEYLLLLDGEELIGAKQNRVVNSSIMAAPKSTLKVPVSCTEEGRWSYMSRNFKDSGIVMPMRSRYNKKSSVDFNLKSSGTYHSNQSQVWNDISYMRSVSNTESPTGAMKDIYTARSSNLDAFVQAFKPIENQTGMVVLVDGEVASLEVFSKVSALRALLPKLIKSYAMHVLVEEPVGVGTEAPEPVETFKSSLRSLSSQFYKSLGEGWDYRFTGDSITGSALVCEEEVIHAVFYNEARTTK